MAATRLALPAQSTCVAFGPVLQTSAVHVDMEGDEVDAAALAAGRRQTATALLAAGTTAAKIAVVAVTATAPSGQLQQCSTIGTLTCAARPTAVAWATVVAPASGLRSVQRLVAGLANFQVVLWDIEVPSVGTETATMHVLGTSTYFGHDDYVNAVAVSPSQYKGPQPQQQQQQQQPPSASESPVLFASVSDDRTCRVWCVGHQQELFRFNLSSAGRDVRWHASDSNKLVVAEESGAVRIFDISTRTMELALHISSGSAPLRSADASSVDPLKFGAITKKRWFTWNLKPSDASSAKQSRSPHESGEAPQDDGSIFRWARHDPYMFATASASGVLRFHNTQYPQVPQSSNLQLPISDLSWHHSLPLCAIACDTYLYFWISTV